MRTITVAVLALVASGCISAAKPLNDPPDPALAPFAALPADARVIAGRAALCGHFAGEIAGDRSARDQEVHRRMGELGCETIEQELGGVRTKYAGNRPVLEVLAPLGGW
ncbi:hypothetical protein ACFFGH_33910 [Lysobacter korlensis]|uniref:Lipoprotein n=1 Tax=Lysobacter korlensis TaxID=553636 RepID=A0ABV6S0T6_9GAMM